MRFPEVQSLRSPNRRYSHHMDLGIFVDPADALRVTQVVRAATEDQETIGSGIPDSWIADQIPVSEKGTAIVQMYTEVINVVCRGWHSRGFVDWSYLAIEVISIGSPLVCERIDGEEMLLVQRQFTPSEVINIGSKTDQTLTISTVGVIVIALIVDWLEQQASVIATD